MAEQQNERPGEYWQHAGYSYVDHQLDPLMEVIRRAADPPFGDLGDVRRCIGAVRAAMDAIEEDFLPAPVSLEQAERWGLALGEQHTHPGDPVGSWCVRLGPPAATRLLWHIAFIPDWPRYENTRRRVSGPRGWVRTAWGNDDAVLGLACRIFDGDDDQPGVLEPWSEATC